MRLLAGTSGFSYAEWKGGFYPPNLPDSAMLGYYSERLPAVEINNTFYRMPKAELLSAWHDGVGPDFRFVLKASRRITHMSRLVNAQDSVDYLFGTAEQCLGDKLGPVLFQLPPFLKKDVGVLRAFLSGLPAGKRAAFEFRHPTWYADDVYEALREKNAALCIGDAEDEGRAPPVVATADWGYLRLRSASYDEARLAEWTATIKGQAWGDVYAFFKHESLGPLYAQDLDARFYGRPRPESIEGYGDKPPPGPAVKPARSARAKGSRKKAG